MQGTAAELISKSHRFATPDAVVAKATITDIAEFDVRSIDYLYCAISVGVTLLNDFQIHAAPVPGGTKVNVSSTHVVNSTATLTTIAAGTTAGALFDVRGLADFLIKAKSALGTATVLVEAGGN